MQLYDNIEFNGQATQRWNIIIIVIIDHMMCQFVGLGHAVDSVELDRRGFGVCSGCLFWISYICNSNSII